MTIFQYSDTSINSIETLNFSDNLDFKCKTVAKFLLRSHFLSIYKNMTIKHIWASNDRRGRGDWVPLIWKQGWGCNIVSRKSGVELKGGLLIEWGFLALTWHFYKEDTNIYNAFQFFWILEISFVKYKISAPISLAEAKPHPFNIHIV